MNFKEKEIIYLMKNLNKKFIFLKNFVENNIKNIVQFYKNIIYLTKNNTENFI